MIMSIQDKEEVVKYGNDWRLKYIKSKKFKTKFVSPGCVLKGLQMAKNKTGKWSQKTLKFTTKEVKIMDGFWEVS